MIYLDNAATTPMAPGVLEAMLPYMTEGFGNPGGIYGLATAAKKVVNVARETIADSLGAERSEIYFTSGGTESDNWALIGVAETYAGKGKHIITSAIEHHGVLHTCKYLEKRGYEVTYVGVDETGLINMEELRRSIRPDTILISVMFANNEVGTIQPVKEIGELAREKGILFHTDAVQAYGHIPVNVKECSIDLLSASGHKFGGPKGIGFLYINKNIKISSYMHGGAQERGRRAGTENVPAIVGMGEAARLAVNHMEKSTAQVRQLSEYLTERILNEIPMCHVNGHRERRLANNVNVSFDFVEGESLLVLLNQNGICASAGSACTSGATDPSHVLLAMGVSKERAGSSLRMTLSEANTKIELDEVVNTIKNLVEKLRGMSAQYDRYRAEREE